MNLVELYAIPEWEREPDIKEFEYKGYQCLIKRIPTMLFLCGYAAIPNFIEGREDFLIDNLCPHGGVTLSEYPDGDYLPLLNSSGERLYWIGFDCGHSCDMIPGLDIRMVFKSEAKYRNMTYVEQEIKEMVNQIIENIQNNGGREV